MKKTILIGTCAAMVIGLGTYFTHALLTGNDPKHDLDLMCGKITELEQKDPNQDPVLRGQEFANFFSAHVGSTEVLRAWSAISNANNADKYRFMVKTAEEVGYPGWTCPALQRMWVR